MGVYKIWPCRKRHRSNTPPNLHPRTSVRTCHAGANAPKFVPFRWGRPPMRLTYRRVQLDYTHSQISIISLTIDTEIKAKRNNIFSELITCRITKAKAKVKFGLRYLYKHECERSSVQLISIRKRKRRNIFRELISL